MRHVHTVKRRTVLAGLLAAVLAAGLSVQGAPIAAASVAAVPRPDHVVVLLMENHSAAGILGNPQAPYINSLAAAGALMTQSFAVTHPSQPNYIALFSGSLNGVIDDSCPHTLTTDNLGAELIGAGLGFVTYSEDLPSVGYAGCGAGAYARKHNPAVNFPSVPASSNQPLTSFPTDYTTLPAVSFLVPNLLHDMHDGTIPQGDAWVQSQISGYVTWAQAHNSILILTFDEDDNSQNNQIPTIIVGGGITPGQYAQRITHYSVLRTLQDAYGLAPIGASTTAAPILDVWTPPAGSPQAAFTVACTGLTCSADGSASTGGSGSITGYRWSWGDGSAAMTGSTATHTYAAPGDFQATLTVTNDAGLSSVVGQPVSPRSIVDPTVFAADAFNRTVTNGFGNADIGGPWVVSGSAAKYSVAAGVGSLAMPTAGTTSAVSLTGLAGTDTDLRVSVSTDKLATGNGTYIGLIARQVSANKLYQGSVRIRGDGVPVLSITALQGSATTVTLKPAIVAPGITLSAGDVLRTRFQVTGTNPTALRLKVWPAAAAEPSSWQLTAADSFAGLQAAGSLTVNTYLSGASVNAPVVLRLSDLTARSTAAAPVNTSPVAMMSVTCADLRCSADGTGSTDSDGTIAGYSWNWGDGSPATNGVISTHSYGSAGTFPVTLTVTDNQGATGTAAGSAGPTAPADTAFVVDRFARTVANGWGSADVGGTWTTTGTASAFSVSGGTGVVGIPKAGTSFTGYLAGTTSDNTDFTVSVATDKLADSSGTYYSFVGRHVATNKEYVSRARVSGTGAVVLSIGALTGTAAAVTFGSQIVVPGLTMTAGSAMLSRLQVTGRNPTTIRAKVWAGSGTEPASWQLTTTDSTPALQAPGSVGFNLYLSSGATNAPIVCRMSNLAARPVAP